MNIKAISSYTGVTSYNKANQKATAASFLQALTAAQSRRDSFTSSLSSTQQNWFNDLRSRFSARGMNWKQGQDLVSSLVDKGILSNGFENLGKMVMIMYPPDCIDENGKAKCVLDASVCTYLTFDPGYEDTTDYTGTLESSLEHQWEAYNSMVEKYGDIYPNEKAYLQEQDKLLGILQRLA